MGLAERYGVPVNVLLKSMTRKEIAECIAYDSLQDRDYREELEGSMMTPEQRNDALVKLLGD